LVEAISTGLHSEEELEKMLPPRLQKERQRRPAKHWNYVVDPEAAYKEEVEGPPPVSEVFGGPIPEEMTYEDYVKSFVLDPKEERQKEAQHEAERKSRVRVAQTEEEKLIALQQKREDAKASTPIGRAAQETLGELPEALKKLNPLENSWWTLFKNLVAFASGVRKVRFAGVRFFLTAMRRSL
jgi:hypothetical protein